MIKHNLAPKHTILNQDESKKVLQKYNVSLIQLPKIIKKDPAIAELNPKTGDVVKIERKSPTNSKTVYYRVVINE